MTRLDLLLAANRAQLSGFFGLARALIEIYEKQIKPTKGMK